MLPMQTQSIATNEPMRLDLSTDDGRYHAVRARDARADGLFYYAVVTTGVYCRPSCAARLARRENVRFHDTPEAAERAGFRPCKRCRPREPAAARRDARLVEEARALLESSESPVKLAELAAGAGLSPSHFHRLFRKQTNMTPQEYAAASRLRRFGQAVREGSTVTQAIYEAGYSSSGRFYEAGGALGMTPSQLRRGAAGLRMGAVVRSCSLGHALVAATARGVCLIAFADRPEQLDEELRRRFPGAVIDSLDQHVQRLASAVVAAVDTGSTPEVPLDLLGTAFQQRVWRALRDIPRGTTTTYAELARRIGAPRAVRAVGTACGANPVAPIVPCHRVLRGDGALGGYRWGLARKKALLARERAGNK
jgi:AraC family transcriptional regulator, regulatory protein of adaptative response / methylated-DNA-[protein]-cysteine methyltransferase